MSRVLVIGATGFIGLNLVDALLAAGHEVRATRRRRSITVYLRRRPVSLVSADLQDVDALTEAMQDCDAVCMAAAHYPRYSLDAEQALREGMDGLANVLQACRNAAVPRLVYTSSSALLCPAPAGRAADEREVPHGPCQDAGEDPGLYIRLKRAMQAQVDEASCDDLQVVSLQVAGCLGPWDVRLGTGGLLVGALAGALPWVVDGHVQLLDVRDVAQAHVSALSPELQVGPYCVAGHGLRLSELMGMLVTRYGAQLPPLYLTPEQARLRADVEEREASRTKQRVPFPRELVDVVCAGQPISSRRAEAALGLSFRPLHESLDAAVQWFQQYGYLPREGLNRRMTCVG